MGFALHNPSYAVLGERDVHVADAIGQSAGDDVVWNGLIATKAEVVAVSMQFK